MQGVKYYLLLSLLQWNGRVPAVELVVCCWRGRADKRIYIYTYREMDLSSAADVGNGGEKAHAERLPSRGACGVPLGKGDQWVEFYDDSTDRSYFYNLVTKETT